jgi:hypothetical protein
MGFASTSVASGHCARVSSCSSVRSHFTTGGVFASAGILALGLVAAPPHFDGARTEVRAMQLAALAFPSTSPSVVGLDGFVRNRVQTLMPVVVRGADIATSLTFLRDTLPSSFLTNAIRATGESATDPTITVQQVDNAALAIGNLPAIPANLPQNVRLLIENIRALIGVGVIIGFFVVLGVVGFVVAGVERVASAIKDILGGFGLQTPIASGTSTATVEPKGTVVPTMTGVPLSSNSARLTTATLKPLDAIRTTEKADVPASTRNATETSGVDDVSTGPTAATRLEPSHSAWTSESMKPTAKLGTPRPVVRDLNAVSERVRDLLHRGVGSHSTTRTAGLPRPKTDESSSAASSSAGSSAAGNNSSGGDASGS